MGEFNTNWYFSKSKILFRSMKNSRKMHDKVMCTPPCLSSLTLLLKTFKVSCIYMISTYLQVRYRSNGRERVFPKLSLLIQKLASLPIVSWLEKAIVEYILQALVEGTKDSLLGQPDWCIHIEFQTFLQKKRAKEIKKGLNTYSYFFFPVLSSSVVIYWFLLGGRRVYT